MLSVQFDLSFHTFVIGYPFKINDWIPEKKMVQPDKKDDNKTDYDKLFRAAEWRKYT